MGTKWATVSTATYADGSPSDDGSATAANKVKYATIKTDLTDPLDTAIDSIVSNLDNYFDHANVTVSTNYTVLADDLERIIEVTGGKTITLLAAATAGVGYRVGVRSMDGNDVTISGTVNGVSGFTLPRYRMHWFYVNAAADGYICDVLSRFGTAIATTSGTSQDDTTTIQPWHTHVDVMLDQVSSNGTDNWLLQLGDSGGIEASGYLAGSMSASDSSTPRVSAYTTGFGLRITSAAAVVSGVIALDLRDRANNVWEASGVLYRSDNTEMITVAGRKNLSTTLDRVRLTTTGGTDTWDAGVLAIKAS